MGFRIGTRKSALAKVQSESIRSRLEARGLSCELVEVVSSGDKDHTTPLYTLEPGSPGLFTKQLEAALLERTIDLAVHSLKDLPTEQPAELVVAAIPERVDAADCLLINQAKVSPAEVLSLPRGARVGSSSLRREAQLLSQRPDLNVIPIRGNVPTRVQAAASGKFDAVVLAEAGLHRLGIDLSGVAKVVLTGPVFIGAPGQGALALETRRDCEGSLAKVLRSFNDERAEQETRIERLVLRALEGGCTLPLGVHCDAGGGSLKLTAFLGIHKPGAIHDWISFHHFDLSEPLEEVLVEKTVRHFRGILGR